MKNILFLILIFLASFSISFAIDNVKFPYGDGQNTIDAPIDPGKILYNENIGQKDGVLNKLIKLFQLEDNVAEENSFTKFIINIINIILGLVSFIALVYLIYAFYRLFFVKYDAGITTARKILTGLLIAILVIGLSWVIVSYFFKIWGVIKGG